jgi:hypothetical protein
MIDAEMMVRFLGFRMGLVEYRGNLKVFLDAVCKTLNEQWETLGDMTQGELTGLESAIEAAMQIFGSEAACHKWSGTKWERSFNRAIFDVQINALSYLEVRERSLANAESLREAFKDLCANDTDFSQAISTTTKSLDATRGRFSRWFGVAGEIIGCEIPMPACLEPAAS